MRFRNDRPIARSLSGIAIGRRKTTIKHIRVPASACLSLLPMVHVSCQWCVARGPTLQCCSVMSLSSVHEGQGHSSFCSWLCPPHHSIQAGETGRDTTGGRGQTGRL